MRRGSRRWRTGRPAAPWPLSRADAVALDRAAQDIVADAPAVPIAALMGLAESFRGGEGAGRFSLFFNRLGGAVQRRAAEAEGSKAARWADLWAKLTGGDEPGRGIEPRSRGRILERGHGYPGDGARLMLIDSHVNLHAPQFDEDRDAVIDRARTAGVERMITICDRVSAFERVHAIAIANP